MPRLKDARRTVVSSTQKRFLGWSGLITQVCNFLPISLESWELWMAETMDLQSAEQKVFGEC